MRTLTTAAILSFALAALAPTAATQTIQTPAEASNYARYTQYQDVASFLDAVAKASKQVKVQVVGQASPAGDFPGASLYLAVVTAEGVGTPRALNRKKPTILVLGAQHGNEHSGKEAALALIRDLAVGDLKPLLKQVNVLVMPQTNPYGNLVDKRPNEQGLDLNRDHVKLESPETRAIHAVFSRLDARGDAGRSREGRRLLPREHRLRDQPEHRGRHPALLARHDLQGDRGVRHSRRLHLARVPRDRGDGQPGRGGCAGADRRPPRDADPAEHDRPERRPQQPRHLRDHLVHPGRRVAPRHRRP